MIWTLKLIARVRLEYYLPILRPYPLSPYSSQIWFFLIFFSLLLFFLLGLHYLPTDIASCPVSTFNMILLSYYFLPFKYLPFFLEVIFVLKLIRTILVCEPGLGERSHYPRGFGRKNIIFQGSTGYKSIICFQSL